MKNLKIYQKCIALIGAIAIAGSITGCAKKMKCGIIYEHAHKYTSSAGMTAYRSDELEYFGDLVWSEETVLLTEDIKDMTKFNLVSIAGNGEYLSKQMEQNKPYTVYEYRYTTIETVYKNETSGNNTIIKSDTKLVVKHAWTTNPKHGGLTGRMQDITYKYYGYKIIIDEKGKKRLEESELVDDIFTIFEKYPYIKPGHFTTKEYSKIHREESNKKR